jgi:hypothetical protein
MPDRKSSGLRKAFDELRFGRARTLDLRATLPTASEAEARVEAWLRERQASLGGEVLIITGRGRGSADGIPVVRPAVERRLARLRRLGVVIAAHEHTAGSFVVELAPLSQLLTATRRKKDPPPPSAADAGVLGALEPATRAALKALALRELEILGAPRTDALVADEMARQFSRLTGSLGDGTDREARLRAAITSVLAELSER